MCCICGGLLLEILVTLGSLAGCNGRGGLDHHRLRRWGRLAIFDDSHDGIDVEDPELGPSYPVL